MARPKFETVARVGQPSGIQSIVRRSLRAGEEKPFEVVLYKAHSLKPIRRIIRIATINHAIGIADALWTDPAGEIPTPEQAAGMAEEHNR